MERNESQIRTTQLAFSISRKSGGMFESVRHLAKETQKNGVAVEVLALEDQYSDLDRSRWDPLTLQIFPIVGPQSFGYSSTLDEYLMDNKTDILHVHGLWKYHVVSALRWGRRTQKPSIISTRGMLQPWALERSRTRKLVARFLYQDSCLRRATCLHATASIEMESYRQLGFKNPVVLIPNGVFVPDSIQSIKEPNRGVKQALFISRIHPKKGLLDLVRAWAAVVGSKDQTQPIGAASNTGLSKWELVIVGPDEGGHLAEVMALVNQLGMQDQIQYGGEIWEDQAKWACYQNADLFVLPSYSENFGLVIAEALGCGVPVITTKATPWAELESHRCGWWIETGVAPLVEALRAAMASPLEQLHEMGIRGRQLIQQKYSWAPIGRQMTAVYEWMAGRSRKPDCVVED